MFASASERFAPLASCMKGAPTFRKTHGDAAGVSFPADRAYDRPVVLANLINLIARRRPGDYDTDFVRAVSVRQVPPRNRRVERLIWICWGLIAIKTIVVVWAVRHYRIPFNAMWVVVPTIVFAALCTGVYYLRRR